MKPPATLQDACMVAGLVYGITIIVSLLVAMFIRVLVVVLEKRDERAEKAS